MGNNASLPGERIDSPVKIIPPGAFSLCNYVECKRANIKNVYKVSDKEIGAGAYGFVCKAVNLDSKEVRACKTIPRQLMEHNQLATEIGALKTMSHPNIIKIFGAFEDTKFVYIIMELCEGGSPLDRVSETKNLSETDTACLLKQAFRGLHYMCGMQICHRDLRPENFLLSGTPKTKVEEVTLKIIDFGLSKVYERGTFLSTKVGSAFYTAPQVLAGKYTEACDLWSMGAIMYYLLCGYHPFDGKSELTVLSRVRRGVFSLDGKMWENVSEDAKDLVRGLLTMEPDQRFTTADSLRHIWFSKFAANQHGAVTVGIIDNMQKFQKANNLKKAALQIIAHHTPEKELQMIRNAFLEIDGQGDGNGMISVGVLKTVLDQLGVNIDDVETLVKEVDTGGLGSIDYNEFVAATLEDCTYGEEEACWVAFNTFDSDGDGVISVDELSQTLNCDQLPEDVKKTTLDNVMTEVEHDAQGIHFEDFVVMMRRGSAVIDAFKADGPRITQAKERRLHASAGPKRPAGPTGRKR